jgi:sugar transferase (PEP-CTERM system associated)
MIRIFNHYVHRASVQGLMFDLGWVLLVALVSVLMQVERLDQVVTLAGTHVVSFAACMAVIGGASGLYEPPAQAQAHVSRSWSRALLVLLLALPLAYSIFGLLPSGLVNRSAIQWSMMAGVAALTLRRAYMTQSSATVSGRARILIYGAGPAAEMVGRTLRTSDPNAHIVGYMVGPNEKEVAVGPGEVLAASGSLLETVSRLRVDEIVVALTERRSGSMPLRQLLDCKASGVRVCDLNSHFEKTLGQFRLDYLNASWLIFGDGFNQGAWRTAVKRVFDIICASLLCVLTLPVMALAAVLIKLESKGPVLYRQDRVGLNGEKFSIAKFRSMRTDAELDGKPRWAAANDDRITRVGHFIRRVRIDELPQLFNVLRGDMSLVGPRPERPFFVDQLTREIPYYALRHSVKPGVTGWAQVRYQYGATIEDSQEKLQYDLYYVKNHSLFLDMIVLLETVGVVLTGKGSR